jgi:ribonuclease BN (tRNA processing enzyme)
VRLTIVGSAAAWAGDGDEASSCYLVEGDDGAIVLDMGQGSFGHLRVRRRPETIAAVFVSHLHPDHCIDLIPLRHYLRYEAAAAPGTIALHAAAGLPDRFDALFGERGFLADLRFALLVPGEIVSGDLRVTVAPVTHTEASFAFRVSSAVDADGAGLVYSGDCGNADDLLPLLRPGDTLLAEASFGAENVPTGVAHLDARSAARAAARGQAARLVLTHLQPTVDPKRALEAARQAWDGETHLATHGLELQI